MITRLKEHKYAHAPNAAAALATVVLAAVTLVMLPAVAEAQEEVAAGLAANAQNANNIADPAPSRPAPAMPLMVEPGDTLWSISQERLGPDALPEPIGNEVERIVELNRNRIGENPDLILPGQKLLLPPPVAGPGTSGRAPVTTEPASEPVVVEETPAPAEAPLALPDVPEVEHVEPVAATIASLPEPDDRRQLLGLGILVLSLGGAGVGASMLVTKLVRSSLNAWCELSVDV